MLYACIAVCILHFFQWLSQPSWCTNWYQNMLGWCDVSCCFNLSLHGKKCLRFLSCNFHYHTLAGNQNQPSLKIFTIYKENLNSIYMHPSVSIHLLNIGGFTVNDDYKMVDNMIDYKIINIPACFAGLWKLANISHLLFNLDSSSGMMFCWKDLKSKETKYCNVSFTAWKGW